LHLGGEVRPERAAQLAGRQMAKVVWLASYPRSGNTWARFLLANLMLGEITASSQVGNQVPDIHVCINAQHLFGPHTTIVKTHWKYWTGIPLREDTIGAIYLVRNPIDVLESNENYALMRSGHLREQATEQEVAELAERWVDDYIANGGYPRFQQFGIGTWEDNVRSWLWPGLALPRLLVRYEELVWDPAAGLAKMARFLGLQKSDDEIARAVDQSSRTRMREIEEREIAKGIEGLFYQTRNRSGIEAGHRFVGRSASGTPLFTLSAEQRAAAERRFGPPMKELGYA
jgi:hypothetical protein